MENAGRRASMKKCKNCDGSGVRYIVNDIPYKDRGKIIIRDMGYFELCTCNKHYKGVKLRVSK